MVKAVTYVDYGHGEPFRKRSPLKRPGRYRSRFCIRLVTATRSTRSGSYLDKRGKCPSVIETSSPMLWHADARPVCDLPKSLLLNLAISDRKRAMPCRKACLIRLPANKNCKMGPDPRLKFGTWENCVRMMRRSKGNVQLSL